MEREQGRSATNAISALLTSPYLALTAAALFWAGNFIVGRALRSDIPPVALNFWRWITALLVVLPLSYHQLYQHRSLLVARWKIIAALGLTGVTTFHICVYLALTTTTAINALLFLSLTPVVIVLASWLFFRDTVTPRQMLGVIISLIGAVVLIAHGDPAALLLLRFNPGDLWMLLAVLLWATYSILLKRRPAQLPPLALLTSSILVGLLFMLPLYLWSNAAGEYMHIEFSNILGILYIGIFASVLAFLFWNRGVMQIGPNQAGMFLHLMPVFGALLSIVLLNEGIAPFHAAGAALVCCGITLMNWKQAHR